MKQKINLHCTFTFCGDEVSETERRRYYFFVVTFRKIDTRSSDLLYAGLVWPVWPLLFLSVYNASKTCVKFGMTYTNSFSIPHHSLINLLVVVRQTSP